MKEIESFVPRLRPGLKVERRDDGTAVLADTSAGVFVEIAADQASLLAFLDGQRTTSDIAAGHYHQHRYVPFQALGDLLATLRAKGMLENGDDALDNAGIPRPARAVRSRSWASMRLARLPLGAARPLAIGLGALLALLLLAGLGLALAGQPFWFLRAHVDALRPEGSPLLGLGGLALGLFAALLARSVARAALAALLGAPIAALELRLHYGLPVLEVEAAPMLLLNRSRRLLVHAGALLTPWLLALGVVASAKTPVAVTVALGVAAVAFLDACPFAPTSLGQLLATLAGRVDLRDHARSYLSRRFLSRVGTSDFFEGEKVILVTATLSALWTLEMVDVLARNAPKALLGLFASALTAEPGERVAAWLLAALVAAVSVASLVLLAQTVVAALSSLVPSALRRKPARATESKALAESGRDAAAAIKAIPLFAALPQEAFDGLAREMTVVKYPKGAVVVRQGDQGDKFFAVLEGETEVEREQESGLSRVIAVLQPGDCFGEMALLAPVPRNATVRARTPVTALSLGREGFARLAQALPGLDLTRMIRASATLNRNPLFHGLPAERIASLLPRLQRSEVAAGTQVVKRGDPGDLFYLVDEGELEVLDKADAAPVAVLKAGDHFGEVALLRDTPRIATVRATRNSALFTLAKADFFSVLGRDLSLSRSLEERAQERVKADRA